jgi:uncharacterized protein (DUF1330 family)
MVTAMTAYLLADVPPDDPEAYAASGYLDAAKQTSRAYGGVYKARGGATTVLEGAWEPDRMVLIEFPSMDDLLAWYHSPEYQNWVAVRQKFVPNSRLVALEGVD